MRSGLSKVATGWTGSIVVTIGAVSVTLTPGGRESVASLATELCRQCTIVHGGTWRLAVTSSARLALYSSETFNLTISSVAATRFGWANDTGVTSVVGSTAHYGAYYPAYGIGWGTDGGPDELAAPTSDGSNAGSVRRTTVNRSILAWDAYAASWDAEADIYGVYDVWSLGNASPGEDPLIRTRVRIASWSREPLGHLPQHVTLTANATEVA